MLANELTWEIKHFLIHYWLIEIRVFCSGRFCYGSVCWTSPLLDPQLCQIPALLNFYLLYPPWPRGQMEVDVLCSLVPLWHEDVRHRNRILQERCGCLLCSRELTAEVPVSSHSPRNGMDGHWNDLPELSSLITVFFTVKKKQHLFCQCCRYLSWEIFRDLLCLHLTYFSVRHTMSNMYRNT